MKKNFLYFLIFFLINFNALANYTYEKQKNLINNGSINNNINCGQLVNFLGGLNRIELLWLGDLREEKFQYALINTLDKSNKKIFYLCENKQGLKITSEETLAVLKQRNLRNIYYDSISLFEDIFSLTSKESRKYIMSTLNLNSFNIDKNQLNQAYIAGLMKLNENLIETKNENSTNKNKKINENNNKSQKIAKTETSKVLQIESADKNPPAIIINQKIVSNKYNYILNGEVKDDTSKNIYVEIDGVIQKTTNGKFSFERFSVMNEKVAIVAIDQWGNRSKEKIIDVIIDVENYKSVEALEKLDPFKIKSNKLNNNKVALIIGIENYISNPKAIYANNDAKFFYQYVRNIFGVKQENIKLLIDDDANLISSLSVLNKWLPSKIKQNQTELIIYFAGHGLASTDGKNLYLLPQDGDSDLLERTAISRKEIFELVNELNPKNVNIFFDTCFSGISRDDKSLLASARPIRIIADKQNDIPENFTIFSASQLNQISSGLKEANHGIFSYYLMKGLEGNADQNDDKKITNGELLSYLDENVSQKASELGRQQEPMLSGDPDKVLISFQ